MKKKRVEKEGVDIDKYRVIFENSKDIIITTDLKLKIVDINPAFKTITGYDPKDYIGKSALKIPFISKESISVLTKKTAEFMKKGDVDPYVIEIKKKNGSFGWFEINPFALKKGKKKVGFQAITRDVTDQKKQEDKLRISEERLLRSQKIGKIGSWEYNIQTKKFWGSDQARKIYGFDIDSSPFSTKTVEGCIPERKRVHQALMDLIAKNKPYDITFDIITYDKNVRKTIHSIAEISYDHNKKPLYVDGVIIDVTDQKKSEEKLKESEERYKGVVETTNDFIVIHDFGGKILYSNRAAHKKLGFSKKQMEGKKVSDFVTKESLSQLEKNKSERKQGNEDYLSYKISIIDKKKEIRVLEVNSSELYKDEKPYAILLVARDITERQKVLDHFKETQTRLHVAMEQGKIAWWEMEIPSGKVKFSPLKTKMLGYSSKNFSHYTDFARLLHEDDQPIAMKAMKDHIEGRKDHYEVEYRIKTKSGEYRWFRDFGALVKSGEKKGSKKSSKKILGVVQDITEQKKSEEQVKQSEKKFRIFTENSPDTIMRFDRQHRHLYANPATKKLTGIDPEKFMGKTHAELGFPKHLVEMWEPAMDKVFRTKKINRIEFLLPDGKWVDWYLIPEFDISGKVSAVLTFARDITEIKRAQEELLEERNKNQEYIDLAPMIFVMLDKKGKVSMVNKKASEMLGYSKEGLVKTRWVDKFVPDGERSEVKKAFNRVLKKKEKYLYFENHIIDKKGNKFLVAWYNTLLKDKQGNIKGVLSIGQDITEIRKNQEELRDSEKKFREIFDNSQEMIMIRDMTPKFLEVNKLCVKKLGYSKEELLKKGPASLDAPEYRRLIPARVKEILTQDYATFETEHMTKKGRRLPLEITSKKINYEGKDAIMSYARDVSERKKNEDILNKRIKELEDFENVTVDRELRMKEIENENERLKEEIGRLKKRSGAK